MKNLTLSNHNKKDNLVLISPDAFGIIRKERLSRIDIQKALYELSQLPCSEVFEGMPVRTDVRGGGSEIPEWLVEKCKGDPKALVPLHRGPEGIKIIVAGGPGPAMIGYISTWGFGPAYFITKPIKLPQNWGNLLEKYKGWESPIVK